MTRRLLLSYLAITLIVLLVLEIPLAIFYSQREEERLIADAERDAVVLASFYEDVLQLGFQPDTAPAGDFASRTGARIVLVDTDGISVLDTGAAAGRDFSTRPEIQTALSGRRAAGIRRSDTLDTDILFVAVPVASAGVVYGSLRLTLDAHEVSERIQRFWIALVAVAAVILVSVAGIGWAIARSVTRPIRELEASARRFAGGDLRTTNLDPEAPAEIAALGESMNAMATRLEQLIDAQRAFVGDASHQLRTPLTALRLRLENLETRLSEEADIAETSAAINEIERLSTLVSDLLRLARAEEHPPVELIDAGQVVSNRVEIWSALAAEQDVGLEYHGPTDQVWVRVIPGAVEQILDNTIDNALRLTPSGSAVEIELRPGPTTKIEICDHGPGLSDDDKVRAIQRFWRGESSTAGTGLGLAIARSLAEGSNGTLELDDTPGGGLTLVVELPGESAP